MINRVRTKIPKSLKDKANTWKTELLVQRALSRAAGIDVPKKFINRYKKKDVLIALAKIYNNLCCYCDSSVGIVDFPHIEHRRPKGRFPRRTFDWANLHLACTKCNIAKGEQWDSHNPILDAIVDIPISDHFSYRAGFCLERTPRGKTTKDHADLNRDELVNARETIEARVVNIIERINDDPRTTDADIARRELDRLADEEYGAFVDHLRKVFLK